MKRKSVPVMGRLLMLGAFLTGTGQTRAAQILASVADEVEKLERKIKRLEAAGSVSRSAASRSKSRRIAK